ncbi:hypothetical protein MMC27_007110 [Xylographa pallens]|nr:hypothetical protein [Xylographa pallens]
MDNNNTDQLEVLGQSGTDIVEHRADMHVARFSRPHISLDDFVEDLTHSLKRVFPIQPKNYDGVYVLLLRWADDDLGTHTEVTALDKVFRQLYHYKTQCELIPSKDPKKFLQEKVMDFRRDYDKEDENNLLIVYYGGHGVEPGGSKPKNHSVWAANQKSDSATVNWTKIQPLLAEDAVSDVLFILDCCYASTAGTRGAIKGSKEVLAACSMEDRTTGVHDNSFTSNLIEILKEGSTQQLTAWKVSKRLMARRDINRLLYTPRHFPLSDGDASCIPLFPLNEDLTLTSQIYHTRRDSSTDLPDTPPLTENASTITDEDDSLIEDRIVISINLKDWTQPPSAKQWLAYLSERVPENLKSIRVSYSPGNKNGSALLPIPSEKDTMKYIEDLSTLPDLGRVRRVEEELVRTESAFESNSMLLLVSVPLPVWDFLPDNPAYSFVGYIHSANLAPSSVTLSRKNSIPNEIKNGITELDRRYWWYKWYALVLCISVPLVYWPASINQGFQSLLSFLAFVITLTAAPFGFLSLVDVFNSPVMLVNDTGSFRGKHHPTRDSQRRTTQEL